MKTRSRHNSKLQRNIRLLLLARVLLILCLLLPRIATGISQVVFYPVHVVDTWLRESPSSIPSYFRNRSELLDKVESLENELAVAKSSNLTQQRLYEENTWLRSLLGASIEDRIAAAVIARPNRLPYDLLQIDQGRNDGVQVGAPVYLGVDTVIGSVVQAAPEYAFVQLFTSPGFEVTAFISGANVVAPVEGLGGGVARVRVPQGIPISVDNVVHVPTIEPGAFGRISFVENRPSQPEQYGYITMEESINSIHYVAVGKTPITPANPEAVETTIQDLLRASLKLDAETIEQLNATITSSSTATTTDSTATTTSAEL